MAKLSDIIETFIKEMLEKNDESELQIVRNELANYFNCAPSQINYVLTTRFTSDRGYYIESRRGGGGYIIIRRIAFEKNRSLLDNINEKIGDNITYNIGVQIIEGLLELGMITEREARISKIAINDRTLKICSEDRNKLRASILKSIIMLILNKS
jgi:transcriptional regulator CtsR